MTYLTFENCGFETGDLTGWASYSEETEESYLAVSTDAKYYGEYGLKMHAHIVRPDTGNFQVWARKTFTINSGDVRYG